MFVRPAETYTCSNINGAVKLYTEESDPVALHPVTIPHFFKEYCKKYSSQPALRYEKNEEVQCDNFTEKDLKWMTVTYAEFNEKVEHVALMLINLGLKSHDVVGIISNNRPEWLYAQFGTSRAGGILFGASVSSSAEAIQHMLGMASAAFCIVEDSEQLAKVRAVRASLPKLRAVIQLNVSQENELCREEGYYFWADLMKPSCEKYRNELIKREESIYANECAMLLYTSGTVGMPKAVMLSHDNLIWNTKTFLQTLSCSEKTSAGSVVSFLPLCHIIGQIYDVFSAIMLGECIYFARPNALKGTLKSTLQSAKPTRFIGVPRVYEKLRDHIETNKDLEKPRQSIGMERCKAFLSAGAPLSPDLKEYFNRCGMLLINVYGLSETAGGITFNFDPMKDSVGKVMKGVEVRTENCGIEQLKELCFRGRTIFMGYLNEPKKTAEAIDADGWFHTGDGGYIDSDNYIILQTRIKELVITSGGENIPPIQIEEKIKKELPAISNAMVVGDQRKYITVLLTFKTHIDPDTGRPMNELAPKAVNWLSSLGFKHRNLSELFNIPGGFDETNFFPKVDPKINAAIEAGIQRANNFALKRPHRVKKFALLPHDFSIPTGELGPTLKLRRNFVSKKYESIINRMYDP